MSTAADTLPRQIVVLSGKGGTGKTTVVGALAALAENAVLADCDVDGADLHLLLDPRPVREEGFHAGMVATILADRCCACGACAEQCRFEAITVDEDAMGPQMFVVDPIACEGCGLCSLVCTCDAVTMVEPERGRLFVSDTRHGPLVHARLNPGADNSGKLVTRVRNEALRVATEAGAETILVDGPPGVACAVIAAVSGADLVLLVTEPTVSGLHDLERVVNLAEQFDATLALCMNRSDINPALSDSICAWARAREIAVVGVLPFDAAVVEAQVRGKSIVEHGRSPVADQLRHMWDVMDEMSKKASEEDGMWT